MSRNDELFENAQRVLPGGTTRTTLSVPPSAPYAVRGDGAYVVDEDGHEVIDCNNNYTALIHGHRFQPSIRAAQEVMEHGTSFGLPTKYEVEFAELLAERIPHMNQWRFANSGTEAVMQAIRIARAATGRDVIVRFQGSYHGTSDAVVDVSAPGIPKAIAETVITVPVGSLHDLKQTVDENGKNIAAVLVDLMPNRAGLKPLEEDFVLALRNLTREIGALLIVDEVITFRTEHAGMQARYGLKPDLTTLGKTIGGGFPVGAVGGSSEVMAIADPRRSGSLAWGGTFSANPVTMAAGKAALSAFDEESIRSLNNKGEVIRHDLKNEGIPCAGDGSLLRLFADDPSKLWWAAYQRGVLLGTNGLLALSTAMTDDDIESVRERISAAWESLTN